MTRYERLSANVERLLPANETVAFWSGVRIDNLRKQPLDCGTEEIDWTRLITPDLDIGLLQPQLLRRISLWD